MKRSNSVRERDETHGPVTNTSEIRKIVKEITESKLPNKERLILFEKKYPDFAKQFDVLLKMACAPEFDMNRFNYMMDMRDKVINKIETEESASVKVGQDLFDEYVKPYNFT